MRVVDGQVPQKASAGLKPTLIAQNYFLACACYPETDIEVVLPDAALGKMNTRVMRVEQLNADVLGIWLKPSRPLEYKAGQFINLFKDESTTRSYSLASVPALEDTLFLNVRRVPDGLMSSWLFENLRPDDELTISDAAGDCFYITGKPEQNILLIATGSGLAPLYGIIRDALLNGHQGNLSLYHGSYNPDGFYLVEELRQLMLAHQNFKYIPCVSDGEATDGYAPGMVLDVAMTKHADLTGWRVFLCGNPEMVKAAKRQTFFAGASMRDIFADPF